MPMYNSIVISLIYLIRIVWWFKGARSSNFRPFWISSAGRGNNWDVTVTMKLKLKKNSKETQKRQKGAWMGKIGKDWNGETWNMAARLFQVCMSICVIALLCHRFLNKRKPFSQFKVRDLHLPKINGVT